MPKWGSSQEYKFGSTFKQTLNVIKSIYKKSTANIVIKGERLNAFPWRLRKKHECLLSPRLSNTGMEVLASALQQGKEIKRMQTGNEEAKFYLFMNHMIVST